MCCEHTTSCVPFYYVHILFCVHMCDLYLYLFVRVPTSDNMRVHVLECVLYTYMQMLQFESEGGVFVLYV